MASQIPFTPLTPEALARLTPAERHTFALAAEQLAADQKPSMMTIVALVETVGRLIGEHPDDAARGSTIAVETSRAESPAPVPAGPAAATTTAAEALPVAAAPDREALGRMVHRVRLAHNDRLERPFHLEPWEERSPGQRELDMAIGQAVADYALTGNAATYGISCADCAAHLDQANVERERAERAEAKLAAITSDLRQLAEGCGDLASNGAGLDRHTSASLAYRAVAVDILQIIGTEGDGDHA